MRCFYHPDREAVGLCKNCAKGLCAESAVDLGDGLACPGSCEKRVEGFNSMMATWQRLTPASSSFMRSSMLFLGATFVAFGVFAWAAWGDAAFAVWLLILGSLFLATPAHQLLSGRLRNS
jgi:hypothetical protein